MHTPRWGLFFDFHTMPALPDVGARFDVEHFTDRIRACGVDYIVFPARCNLGMAYYDTRAGIRHYSLSYDLFGRLADACRRKGIALTAYLNVGLSHEEALLHRDWTTLSPEGYGYAPDRLSHWFRPMCFNSPYAGHLLAMVREVVSGYPVAGLFLDCMKIFPCIGVECVREMKQRGLDWSDSRQVREFAHVSRLRLARRIAETACSIRPDLLLYFNGIPFEDQRDIATYFEYECLPTGGWGYETLPVFARYLRTLGKPALNMTGRFHRSWGDFGGLRTEASLEYDCLYGLANGLPPTIGGHAHPRGDNEDAVFDLIEPVYRRLQRLSPWLEQAVPVTDAAVVMPPPAVQAKDPEAQPRALQSVMGAVRMLCELKVQFDVVTPAADWSRYRLLILPDEVLLDDEHARRVRAHLDAGKPLLASAWSGLDPARRAFVFEDWGATFRGECPHDPAYYVAEDAFGAGIPRMPNNFYGAGVALTARPGTDVLARIIAPYFNRHWDGEHGFLYLPPDRPTADPAVTLHGRTAVISHAVFRAYHDCAAVPLKRIVANLLDRLLPEPLIRAPGLPSFARVTVTAQPARRMVHLLACVPERRGANVDMIEEALTLTDVEVALRTDGPPPRRVYLAPDNRPLEFRVDSGYVTIALPRVNGHALAVCEQTA